MGAINIKKLGFAVGSTFALLYLGCIVLMITVGREGTVLFFNSILHGLDVTSMIRMNVPWPEAVIGIIEIFILGWLTGGVIAGIYNFGLKNK